MSASMFNSPEFFWICVLLYPVLIMLPGPDTVAVAQHSLRHGWRSGLACAQGTALGACVCLLWVLGFWALFPRFYWVGMGTVLGFFVGAYFVYHGAKNLRTRVPGLEPAPSPDERPPSPGQARLSGFLNTALNAKVSMYIGALLFVALMTYESLMLVAVVGLGVVLWHLVWFCMLARVLSKPRPQQAYQKNAEGVDQALGLLLVLHGLLNAMALFKY